MYGPRGDIHDNGPRKLEVFCMDFGLNDPIRNQQKLMQMWVPVWRDCPTVPACPVKDSFDMQDFGEQLAFAVKTKRRDVIF